jgi:hypothetical protein
MRTCGCSSPAAAALVEESCDAERRLHAALLAAPTRPVAPLELLALADADARDNYGALPPLPRRLAGGGTLEAWYLAVFRVGAIDLPPLFIDRVAEAIVRNLVDGVDDALLLRAAELLFRPQRIALLDGRVLAADSETADRLSDPGSLDPLGRLLRQEPGPMPLPAWRSSTPTTPRATSTPASATPSPSTSRKPSPPTSATA